MRTLELPGLGSRRRALLVSVFFSFGAANVTAAPPAPEDQRAGVAPTPETEAEPVESTTEGPSAPEDLDERTRRERWRIRDPELDLPDRAEVLSLTISGGVSLGSIEAGQVDLLTEALRRSPGSARLLITTGASAGSANALIAATSACLEDGESDEEPLGYRVWVPVGLDQLFVPERVTARNLFTPEGLERGIEAIRKEWSKGLAASCDFVIGVTATREHAYEVELAPGLIAPRQAEHFLVRVRGTRGGAPALTNYVDPSSSFERPLLPLSDSADPSGRRGFDAIREVLLASAAFPVAFPAQSIEHCLTPRRADEQTSSSAPPRCDSPTRKDDFVDGGVFDNSPLGLAYQIAQQGLVPRAGGASLRPLPRSEPGPRPKIVYGYLDPELTRYPLFVPDEGRDDSKDPLLGLLFRFGGQVLTSARGQELAVLAEKYPHALRRVWLLQSGYPPISSLLGAFFGFFERDFRDFDYHLGRYDSFYELREHTGSILGVERYVEELTRSFAGQPSQVPPRHKKLGCMLAHFEPERYQRLTPLCGGDELHNFRVLLQVTLDRLWANCRRLDESEAARAQHRQCLRASSGKAAPLVDPKFVVEGARYPTEVETDFDYSLRLLGSYGFHFKDLGLKPDEAHKGRLRVRRKLADMVEALANAQPNLTDRTLVLTGGRTVVNGIDYEPPPHRVYALLGTSLAVGSLHRVFEARSLFFNPDARLSNVRTLLTDRTNQFAGTISAGFEWTIFPLSSSLVQTSVGLRAGYQMTGNDSFGFESCAETFDPRECSQLVLHTPVNLTLVERVRLNLTPLFYPVPESFGHRLFDLELGVGAEFF